MFPRHCERSEVIQTIVPLYYCLDCRVGLRPSRNDTCVYSCSFVVYFSVHFVCLITDIAVVIIPATSAVFAGMIIVLFVLASFSNAST